MTSPQPPGPQPRAAAGNGVNEETLHLPTITAATAPPRTAPSPYAPRPAFRPPMPPPPAAGTPPRPAPVPAAPPTVKRWEGMGFRPDIQGLRAIAVVLVLLSHAGFGFAAGGYVGVDVFFVVSGFLITSLLVKEVHDTGGISISGFYARRARRILPAASVVTIATIIGAWLWFPITRLEAVLQDAFTVIVYVVNYRFIAQETEYLNADQMPSPFQQFWSLAVEEQFYLVWPLLLVGLLMLIKRRPDRFVATATAFACGIFAISLVLSVYVTQQSEPVAYYGAHTRAWELAGGALLALSLPALKRTPKYLAWGLGIAGLAAIIAAGAFYTESTSFPGYTALLPVAGTAMVIIAGSAKGTNPASSLLGTGPFQFVGKISYSLYLWHWPILILIPLAVGAESGILLNSTLLLGAVAVAQFSYQYVEEPFRKAKLMARPLPGIGAGVVCSLTGLAVLLAFTTVYSKVPEDQDPVDLGAVEQVEDDDQVTEQLTAALALTEAPADLTPPLADIVKDEPVIYADGCHVGTDGIDLPSGCVYGDPDSDTTVYLFGDSHAAQWFPAMEALAVENGWKLVPRTKSACTPVTVAVDNSSLDREYTECADWRDKVFEELATVQPALVLIAGSDAASVIDASEGGGLGRWRNGWTDTLEEMPDATKVATLTDTPWSFGDAAADCVSINPLTECNDDYGIEFTERRETGVEVQQGMGATVIDSSAWFCVDDQCPVVVGNLLVYRDKHHMTTPYATSLADVLGAALPQL
ncbi:acyltransferase family protein [Glycomyces sp. NPDC021274]|uniref:acyltransferase family protein n=1 Tax=Glycomyces sp. NPDC021274 TaxID=3155120 RepID=UPI00340C05DC